MVLTNCSSDLAKDTSIDTRPAETAPDIKAPEPEIVPGVYPANFEDLPGWENSDLGPAYRAFRESCVRILKRDPDAPLSKTARYGGQVRDWRPVCEVMKVLPEGQDLHASFETLFRPVRIEGEGTTSKLTGYFEPELKVSYFPTPGHTQAVPGLPDDMVRVTLDDFGPDLGSGTFWGRLRQGRLKPYPDRADIVDDPKRALAWAHPADVFYLQIQGSGRLTFPDGKVQRAAFAAHNSKPFKSTARYLIDKGEITASEAGITGVRAWMDRAGSVKAKDAMDANPRYVWFKAETIADPAKGPRGAEGTPLTPLGSMAVDPAYHPYGAPIFLDTRIPSQPGDWQGQAFQQLVIAQDTGGAIRGDLRGDLFFGWGNDAGARAGNQNHAVAMWALLPRKLADAMDMSAQTPEELSP